MPKCDYPECTEEAKFIWHGLKGNKSFCESHKQALKEWDSDANIEEIIRKGEK